MSSRLNSSIQRRTAIVTGGTGDIGRAIAEELLTQGMNVAILGKTKESVDSARRELSKEFKNVGVWQCDLITVSQIENVIHSIHAHFESIDVLVNCAGIFESNRIEDISEFEWNQVIDLNLKAAFFMVQKALPYLKNANSARIINISSNAGRMGGYANGSAYAASKGGLIALTYSLARKLGPHGITVNCVAPGTIESRISEHIDNEMRESLKEKFPLLRFGSTTEVAAAVSYFASVNSSFTTGAVLDINGGLFMG
jgi:3-oxoacyl-[acyl-carrier protein] reductase